MSNPTPKPGTILWTDLTVSDAEGISDFYRDVVGWQRENVPVADYHDFNMMPPEGDAAAGICHARGINARIPPVWMVYIVVEDLQASMDRCTANGGRVILSPDDVDATVHHAILQDPAGAYFAIFQPPAEE